MSGSAVSWVLRNSETRGTKRLVLLVLAYHADTNPDVRPSVATIARQARVSERSARRSLRALKAAGPASTGPAEYGIFIDEPKRAPAANKERKWRELVDEPDYLDVLARDPCCYCGAPFEHYDHIHPQALDGTHTWANLTASCARCNVSKGAKPLLHWLRWSVA